MEELRIDNVSLSNSVFQDHSKCVPTYTVLRRDTLLRGDGGFLDGSAFCLLGVLVRFLAGGISDSLTTIKSGL